MATESVWGNITPIDFSGIKSDNEKVSIREHNRVHKNKLKGLYAITDQQLISEEKFSQSIEAALKGGVKIIQYRDKSRNLKKRQQQATDLRSLCTQYNALCIINDDIDLAAEIKADGVHLGKDDTNLLAARKKLGDDTIIGISCYDDIDLALTAEKNSADYVAFGTMFTSPTKPNAVCAAPEIIAQAKKHIQIPVCAIGGITAENIQHVAIQNADMAAVISSLFTTDNIEYAARKLSQHFNATKF